MSDQPATDPDPDARSREELLRVLHDDPRGVSRAEIKAAFADGRLGDQDLDIPVLAGMRRITELLAELQPGSGSSAAPPTVAPTPRAAASGTRLSELDERVARLESQAAGSPPLDPVVSVQEVADLRATLARLEQAVADQERRLRVISALVMVTFAVAIVAVMAAILVH